MPYQFLDSNSQFSKSFNAISESYVIFTNNCIK